jgi:hypothetical protein
LDPIGLLPFTKSSSKKIWLEIHWLDGLSIAVAPIKIIATSLMTLEEGGLARLHDVIGGMLIGQVTWGAVLLIVWFAVK